jgi:hypothetical protein
MVDQKKCPGSGFHGKHMCELKQQGMMEELDRRSSRPTAICTKCAARADRPDALCNPRPL